jgi:hypothetical protein
MKAGKSFRTKDAEAFSSFVQGRALFQAYLDSGNGEELQQARDRFSIATARDPTFDIARLYLAVSETELREPDAAISNLQKLVKKKRYEPEAHVQLAYAHIKRYQDDSYKRAEAELDNAETAANSENRKDLIALIHGYRVFLLAVRGAYEGKDVEKKKRYLNDAINLGKGMLDRGANKIVPPDEQLALQFEANNAVGIAYMFLERLSPSKPYSDSNFEQSERHLRAALALRPNSVRALQNMARLRMFQADRLREEHKKYGEFYEAAKKLVQKSLDLNSFDQYPHYQMALLSARTEDWENAHKFVEAGRKQKGAVKTESWKAIEDAISHQDGAALLSVSS